jgi:hypothetical protein
MVGDQRHVRPLYWRQRYQDTFVQEAGWAPGPVRTGAENFACKWGLIVEPSKPSPCKFSVKLL